jgi:hypothetical protein
MLHWRFAILSLLIVCVHPASADTAQNAPKYEPDQTTVAILPLVNKAAEYNATFREKTKNKAQQAVSERFTSRGFHVVDAAQVEKCLADMKLDMNERENWRPDTILAVGKKLGARLVLLPVILDAHSKDNNNTLFSGSLFGGSKEGFASVRTYMADTETGASVLQGERKQGKTTSGLFSSFEKGMDRQTVAVVKGFDLALRDFLQQYSKPGDKK